MDEIKRETKKNITNANLGSISLRGGDRIKEENTLNKLGGVKLIKKRD